MQSPKVFIIDDEESIADSLKLLLKSHGVDNVEGFTDKDEMLKHLDEQVRLIIVDYYLYPRDHPYHLKYTGLDLVREVVDRFQHCFFIMFSGQTEMHVAVDFMNAVNDGCKYIIKAAPKWDIELIGYVKRFLKHIDKLKEIYAMADEFKQQSKELRTLIDDGKSLSSQ